METPLIRPELLATLSRWRGVVFGGGVALPGLWLIWLGGYVLAPLGLMIVAVGAGLGVSGWRRMRFAQEVLAPGVVEVIEGEVRFFGPTFGGALALGDLTEVRLMTMRGRRLWRLKQADGQVLLIPIDATGADGLYDAFATLPGMDIPALLASLSPSQVSGQTGLSRQDQPDLQLVWARKGRGLVA